MMSWNSEGIACLPGYSIKFSVLCAYNSYFELTFDARGYPSLTTHQKNIIAIGQMAYGVDSDAMDEYCKIAECIAL